MPLDYRCEPQNDFQSQMQKLVWTGNKYGNRALL